MIKGNDVIDLRKATEGSGTGELPQYIINIIEQNTGTQVNQLILYTEIDWISGNPEVIRKYNNSSKTLLLYTITITWLDGNPTTIVIINHDDSITTAISIYWSGGVPINISKEIS